MSLEELLRIFGRKVGKSEPLTQPEPENLANGF